MTDWTFCNRSRGGRKVRVRSIDHAIELFLEASGEEDYAAIVELWHAPRGLLDSIAGQEFGTLAFDPDYCRKTHRFTNNRFAMPLAPVTEKPLYFVDDTDTLSSIDPPRLLPILDVVRGMEFVLEHYDFPPFLDWQPRGLTR